MSDGVVIPLDVDDSKAKSKVAGLKRAARDAGREYAEAGRTIGRMGGPMGGMIGRATSGFSGGIGMGLAGAGFAAAGLGVGAFMAMDDRRVEAARARSEYQERLAAARRSDDASRRSSAASAAGIVPTMRRLMTRYAGDPMGPMSDIGNVVSATGVSPNEAASAVISAKDSRVSATDIARLMSTGDFSSDQAADSLRSFGSARNALAAARRISPKEADAALATAAAAGAGNVGAVGHAQMAEFTQQYNDVASGNTAKAIARQFSDSQGKSVDALRESTEAARRSLQVAANAQMDCVRALKDIGAFFGIGSGSERTKLDQLNNTVSGGD